MPPLFVDVEHVCDKRNKFLSPGGRSLCDKVIDGRESVALKAYHDPSLAQSRARFQLTVSGSEQYVYVLFPSFSFG